MVTSGGDETAHRLVVLEQVDPENANFVYGKCGACNVGVGGAVTEEELRQNNFEVHKRTEKLKRDWG